MPIQTEINEGKCAARVSGDMTIYAAAELKARCTELLATATELEIDLGEVQEFDCAGLQLLLWLSREAERGHRALRVTRRSAAVADVLTLLNLDVVLGQSPVQG